jgi:hypothetical protein
MKKFIYYFFFIFIFLSILAIIYLSTIGIETSKINNLIINEIEKKEPEIKLELKKIKIKLNLKKIQLTLSTNNPKIIYQDVKIPITKIKVYSKINKMLDSKIEISQITFKIKKFKVQDLQKIATRIKPSNFKTYLLNNLEGGEVEKVLFDLNIDKKFKITNYKANGSIKKINATIGKKFTIKDISFNFKVDENLTLINSINTSYNGFLVSNGSIELQKKNNIKIKGRFNSQFNLNENQLSKLFTTAKVLKKNKIKIQGTLLHEFNLKIDKSYKIIDYNYKSDGNILESSIILKNSFKNDFIKKSIKKISFKEIKLKINFNKKNKNFLTLDGLYSTNESNYKMFKVENNLNKIDQKYLIDFDLSENFFLEVINFRTNSKRKSNIKSELNFKNQKIIFKTIDFIEGKNSISINGLVLNSKNEIEKISAINLITFNNNKENNNFKINFKKKISITGKKYDASNLLKLLSEGNKKKIFKNFTSEVEIKLKNLITKSQIPLSNFNLIGVIKNGKFDKISAKSEFSDKKYLDITLKKDPNDKKILEVYSDNPQALLADYKFFEGIKDGSLLYNSIIDETGSASRVIIENFKVTKAPAFATLLTLADLGGVADLLSGQGMSFDILEINLRDDINITTVDDILALGKSVSLHMEGYIEKKTGLISLNGTLVPAKTLNKLVSKIPVVGNILVGNKVGEGVFGVSFKIKGLPGKVKTTVNPVKTITPRFITRAIEKMQKK